jgi:predicted CopG family antitoxin
MKTIAIPEDLHRELVSLKLEGANKNAAELIRKLIGEYKKKRILEFSNLFRKKLAEKNISFEEFLRRSDKIREELANERANKAGNRY